MNYWAMFALLLSWCHSYAAAIEQQGLPWYLLGRSLSDIEPQFREVIYDAVFEDEVFNGKTDERLLVIDHERRFLTLHTVDRVVTEVFVSDKLYATAKGIRVGDTLSEVRGAYPEAFDQAIRQGRYRASGFHVTENAGQVSFSFISGEINRRLDEGESVRFDDEAVGRSRLMMMRIHAN